jgi:aspartate 1-decarboxylase
MWREMMKSKIHRAVVTDANLNYMGSITVDRVLMEAANLLPHEKVQVVNLNNGARFETYCLPGEPNTGTVCLNGAAARLAQPGDLVIIISYCWLAEEELLSHRPRVVFVDDRNQIVGIEEQWSLAAGAPVS